MPIGSAPGLRPREVDGKKPGLLLALGVHLLLVVILVVGMRATPPQTTPIEAEVWSEIPEVAGGQAEPPPPPLAQPVTPPTPEPEPAPEPVKVRAPEPEPEVVPDVVVAKAPPKKKEEPKRKPKEEREEPEPVPPKVSKKVEKAEKVEKIEKTAKLDKADKPEKNPPKVAASKPVPSKVTAADSKSLTAADLEAQRKANLQRMMSSLGGGSGGPGTGSRSAGPSASYAGRIIARIKPNIVFAENLNGNPLAVVEVRCAPDGRIISRRLVSASGVGSWDEAVLRAVDRTEVLPADVDGRVPSVMQLTFKPRDL